MTSTLGYSREHIFVYTKGKTTEDFLRCIIDTLYRLGGTPEHILTDNMTAVVSITNGSKYKSQDNLTNLLQLSVLSFFRI